MALNLGLEGLAVTKEKVQSDKYLNLGIAYATTQLSFERLISFMKNISNASIIAKTAKTSASNEVIAFAEKLLGCSLENFNDTFKAFDSFVEKMSDAADDVSKIADKNDGKLAAEARPFYTKYQAFMQRAVSSFNKWKQECNSELTQVISNLKLNAQKNNQKPAALLAKATKVKQEIEKLAIGKVERKAGGNFVDDVIQEQVDNFTRASSTVEKYTKAVVQILEASKAA